MHYSSSDKHVSRSKADSTEVRHWLPGHLGVFLDWSPDQERDRFWEASSSRTRHYQGSTLGFTTTYKTAGTANIRGSRTRHRMLWVGLWVGKVYEFCGNPHFRFSESRSSIRLRSRATMVHETVVPFGRRDGENRPKLPGQRF